MPDHRVQIDVTGSPERQQAPEGITLRQLYLPVVTDHIGIDLLKLTVEGVVVEDVVGEKCHLVIGVVPPAGPHIHSLVENIGCRADILHWNLDVLQIAMLFKEPLGLLAIELLAGQLPCELEPGGDRQASQFAIVHTLRIAVQILGFPSAPECWFTVNIHKIVVVSDDVHHDIVDKSRHSLLLRFIQVSMTIQNACEPDIGDRKSTRLNSSHVAISYAVFCLKKKNKNDKMTS